ncbi:MAG: hypothetical protein RBU30_07590 [Polyangia bacterium]|nr:hypothetical protein [Polyangia bacterium]
MRTRFGLVMFGAALGLALAGGCSDDDSSQNNNDNGNQNNNQGLQCLNGFVSSETGRTCVYETLSETIRTPCGDVWEDCDATGMSAPALSCIGQADNPPPNPPTVTIQGFLDVFSAGPEPVGIVVKVFDAATLTGVTRLDDSVSPIAEVTVTQSDIEDDVSAGVARACFSKKDDVGIYQIECPIPTSDCMGACTDSLQGTEFCYQAQCFERLRYEGRYSLSGIPTHRPLVILTLGQDGYTDTTWGVMAQVNVYLRTTDPEYDEVNGTYELDAQVLSRQDWYKIPQTMGLSGGISPGYGALAGEVHDCDGIRLKGAQVGLYPQSNYFAYFNGNPLDTVPLTARLPLGTNNLGLYSEFELPAGEIEVEAWGLVGGTRTLLGQHSSFIFQDAVTVLSINDGKPALD